MRKRLDKHDTIRHGVGDGVRDVIRDVIRDVGEKDAILKKTSNLKKTPDKMPRKTTDKTPRKK